MSESPRKQLRHMLASASDIVVAPGAYDAWSARLIERAGFPAVYMSGYGVSASVLARPDIGLATMTEMVVMARNIVNAVEIPVIVDADNGYGGNLNVMRAVGEFEAAGAAAVQIEDQVMPKRCGHMEGKELVSTSEMAAKLRAAVAARKDPDLVIIARTDARAVLGMDEALSRAKVYIAAGADAIFLEAPESVEEMKRTNQELSAPLLANMVNRGKTPILPVSELKAMGYKIVIYPVLPLYAATKACMEVLELLKLGGHADALQEKLVTFSDFNKDINLGGLRDMEASFSNTVFEEE